MMRLTVPVVVLMFASPPASLLEEQRHHRELYESVAPAVVFIARGESFGSGFFVSEDGLVLTNAHVVGEAAVVQVIRYDGSTSEGRVLQIGLDRVDLALVQTSFEATPVLPWSLEPVHIGDWVASLGHGAGGIWTLTTGMVSNLHPEPQQDPIFQTQIPLNPGSSGGPVLNLQGEVVGLVTAGIKAANSVNFAIRIDQVHRYLTKLPPPARGLHVLAPRAARVFVDGILIGQGPQLIYPLATGEHEVLAVIEGAVHKRRISYPKDRRVELP